VDLRVEISSQARLFDRFEKRRAMSAQRTQRKLRELEEMDNSIKEANKTFIDTMKRIWGADNDPMTSHSEHKGPEKKVAKQKAVSSSDFRQNVQGSIQMATMNLPTDLTNGSHKKTLRPLKGKKNTVGRHQSDSTSGKVSIVLENDMKRQEENEPKNNQKEKEISPELLEYKYWDLYTKEQHEDMRIGELEMHRMRKKINGIYNKFAGTTAYDRLYWLKKSQMVETKKAFRHELENRVREPRVSDFFVDQTVFGNLRDNLLTSPIIK
jgi:hypothetical protein